MLVGQKTGHPIRVAVLTLKGWDELQVVADFWNQMRVDQAFAGG